MRQTNHHKIVFLGLCGDQAYCGSYDWQKLKFWGYPIYFVICPIRAHVKLLLTFLLNEVPKSCRILPDSRHHANQLVSSFPPLISTFFTTAPKYVIILLPRIRKIG